MSAALSPTAAAPAGWHDFDFLHGHWRVHNRRLRRRLQGCTDWERFEGTQFCQPLLDGAGNTDELRGPMGPVGISLRFFDRAAAQWVIHWVSPQDGVLQPPVRGRFDAHGVGVFEGDDLHAGQPVRVRFTWVTRGPDAPCWAQAFSADGGRHWETNWTMHFTRLDAPAPTFERLPHASTDFDFFFGPWQVRNRRRTPAGWEEFSGTQWCAPLLGGLANYDELRDAQGVALGLSIHLYQRATQRWHAHWVSARDGIVQPAMAGGFTHDAGLFEGVDTVQGRQVRVRYHWSGLATATPRWAQEISFDEGARWSTDWTMDYAREGGP